MDTSGPVVFGKYSLLEKIALGGMAELYLGRMIGDEGFEKLTAIKRILPNLCDEKEIVTAFIEEAKLAALLHHPNIVQIYDFGTIEGFHFIAMEYLFGKDLRSVMEMAQERDLPISLESILYIMSRICEGLGYAHGLRNLQGQPLDIIHRDISPQNIFITYDGQVKIIDFGIAKAAGRGKTTKAGVIKGKVGYMSPEQAQGKAIDSRSDIYSTGILLYELVTKRRMFEGHTFEILDKAREARFEPAENIAKDLPAEIYKILNQALVKESDGRYQTASEMYADLEDCIYHLYLRPNAHKLSQYIKTLFREEFLADQFDLALAMKAEAAANPASDVVTHDSGEIPENTASLGSLPLILEPDEDPFSLEYLAGVAEVAEEEVKPGPNRRLMIAAVCLAILLVIAAVLFFVNSRSASLAPRSQMIDTTKGYEVVPGAAYEAGSTGKASIDRLLTLAKESLEDFRLTTPPGDCALYYYEQVGRIDPENEAVRQGYYDIATHYAWLSKKEMRNANYQKAKQHVESGLDIVPDHEGLLALEKKLRLTDRRMERFLMQARRSLEAYRLTSPSGNNALYYYRKVQKIDPKNKEVRRGYYNIATRYGWLAKKEMKRFNYEKAKRYVEKGLTIVPNHETLLALRAQIEAPLHKRLYESIKENLQ
jgi:serine/threonine protein kinase